MISQEDLSKIVVAEFADGKFNFVGQMIGYADRPVAVIRLADGSQVSWMAEIVREATPTEAAIVQTLAPAQNECFHDKNICGRLTRILLLCGRCKKAVEE